MIAAGVLIWQGMFHSQTLTAEDYVDYMVSGLDSEGTAALYFDSEGLLADIQAKKDLTQGEQKDIRRILEGEEEPFTADPGEDLSNGDTVTVKSELDKNLLKKYAGNPIVSDYVKEDQYETDLYAKYHQSYGYVFYIGKKVS